MIKRPTAAGAMCAALLASTVLGQASVAADDPPLPTGELVRSTSPISARAVLSRDEQRDVAEAARTEGVPVAVLTERMTRSAAFGRLVDSLEEEYPESFAAAGLVRGEDEQPWVAFEGAAPQSVRAQLRRLSHDTLLISDAPASRLELEEASALGAAAVQAKLNATSVESSVDPVTFKVTFTYTGTREASPGSVTQEVRSAVRAVDSSLDVAVSHTDADPVEAQATVQGGRRLVSPANSNGYCTAGFTAIRNGNRGVLTAKHCDNDLRYNGTKDVITFGASADDAANGIIDIQFHRTLSPHSTNAQFRTNFDASYDRVVTGFGNPSVGDVVCKWGETTGYGCTVVAEKDVCVMYSDDKTRCGLARTATAITGSGDSGGPWFIGNTARGIHSAGGSIGSLFTQIGRAQTYLGATPITG